MEDKKLKKENKFVDNVAYKSKFQFLIWVNDNVICQRYFKINGFNEESIYTEEFTNCMNGIVQSIQEDLESKSRIFMWYTNLKEPLKLTGFATDNEVEKYGSDFLTLLVNSDVRGDIEAPDGEIFHKEYVEFNEGVANDYGEVERPAEGEYIFKFSFLIDDITVFEKIWDGNVYPKFVRNGVDLTNSYMSYDNKEVSALSFGAAIVRYMQSGKINLISDFIRRICDTLSNTFSDKYVYTKKMDIYRNNDDINEQNREAAIAYYGGVIQPVVTGHMDIKKEDKKYNYLSAYEDYKQSWRKAVSKKTQEYYATMYPSPRQIEYIEKHY